MLKLSREQDGTGYYYGHYATADGGSVRIDVLPPANEPKPHFVVSLPKEQHATQWIVYADGEEIARVERRTDLQTLDIERILPAP